MATTSPAVIPTLQVFSAVPDPTAQYGSPATNVQIQNASPFIITVTVDGEQFTIQSFTAQTLPCGKTGTTLTILPTSGPAGSQGSITCVWLGNHESAPMGDSQLTGAAQYAQGLGTTVGVGPSMQGPINPGLFFPAIMPPTIRTLIVKFVWQIPTTQLVIPDIKIQGAYSLILYYKAPPYLYSFIVSGPNTIVTGAVIVPINSLLDPQINITIYKTSGPATTVSISATAYGDTALFDESTFYNGPLQVSGPLVGVILSGPARLLTATLEAYGATAAALSIDAGQQLLHVDGLAGQNNVVSLSFPPNTILSSGQALTVSGGSPVCTIGWAYP